MSLEYSLLLFGIWFTVLVTQSYLFSNVREFFSESPKLEYLVNCPLCFGTWVGVLLVLVVCNSIDALWLIPSISLGSSLVSSLMER